MEINRTQVYSIQESAEDMRLAKLSDSDNLGSNDLRLMKSLCKLGDGHDNFLSGILVRFQLTAPHNFWAQWQRYHFSQIVGSESKMHCITKMDLDNQCTNRVNHIQLKYPKSLIERYKDEPSNELFEEIIENLPIGLQLTAGISTNYLQLKTMYKQRKNHRSSHWSVDFVKWIKSLPYNYLITGEKES